MKILPRDLWPLADKLSREQLADLAWSLTLYVSTVGDDAQARLFRKHVEKVETLYFVQGQDPRFTKQED